jgi:MFS transporter, AAHS family, 4-hydroxybenzoate transporter
MNTHAIAGTNAGVSMDRSRTVSDIIDQRPLSGLQISTFLLCGLVLVLDGFDAQSLGFLASSMAGTFRVPVSSFGPIFGAALFGPIISAMSSGPIADRLGRKWPIVVSTLIFGIFTALTARATSFNELLAFRLLTGLGLGGAMPNVVSLTSEYAPKRLVPVFVSMVFCGMPAGALLGGTVGAVMLPRWGWQSVLYVGGILPLIVALILVKVLPESVRFLSMSGAAPKKISAILSRISPELADAPVRVSTEEGASREGFPVKHLFTEGRALGTLLLWVPNFMNLLIIYFIVSWLPVLLRQKELPVSAGISAILLFSLGGMAGALLEGRLMNDFGAAILLVVEFGISTLLIGSLAFTTSFLLIMTVTLILGFTVQGAQGGLNALAASFYPTAIRSTGVGWALGAGRVGSIVGPVLGGILLSVGWHPQQIFLAGAIPSLSAAVSIMLTGRMRGNSSAYGPDSCVTTGPKTEGRSEA